MNRMKTFALALLMVMLCAAVLPTAVFAASDASSTEVAQIESDAQTAAGKSIGSGLAIGIAAAGGAIAMGLVVGKAAESVARQPEETGQIRSTMMLGLVFIETAIIYALLVVILIIFVL